MSDLTSILLRLGVGVTFKPRKKYQFDTWTSFCLTSLIFLVWRSLFQCFSLYLLLTFRLLLYLHFFHVIPFRGSIHFFLRIYLTFFGFFGLFFVYYIIFMFILIIIRLNWDGLFTKNEFILSLSCVSGTIIFSKLNVRRFIEIKILPVYLQFLLIHYFDNCGLLFQKLSVAGVVLPWVSIVSLSLSFVPCIRSASVSSFVFVSFIYIPVIFSAFYFFCLLGYLSPAYFGLRTDNQFSLNHCSLFLKTLVWT